MCPIEPDTYADDHYEVLGLQSEATDKDIGAAYKRLALKHHPDKNPDNRKDAEVIFKRITQAYDTLRDQAKRQAYDNSRNKRSGNGKFIPGSLGSLERADELYERFFGGRSNSGSNIHNIDIAGIFNFEQRPPSKPAKTCGNIDIAGIFNFDQKKQSKPAKAPAKSVELAHLISPSTLVVIHGLTSKTEHNGKSATVDKWIAEKGRYEVKLNCGDVLSLRPHNITQLCHVQVTGHENQPELNGKDAEIVDFNDDTGCYVLLLSDPALVIELPPKNCIFPTGTAALLQGLSEEQLCGKMCSIVSLDINAMRYVVQCEGGRQLKVRFEKVMC